MGTALLRRRSADAAAWLHGGRASRGRRPRGRRARAPRAGARTHTYQWAGAARLLHLRGRKPLQRVVQHWHVHQRHQHLGPLDADGPEPLRRRRRAARRGDRESVLPPRQRRRQRERQLQRHAGRGPAAPRSLARACVNESASTTACSGVRASSSSRFGPAPPPFFTLLIRPYAPPPPRTSDAGCPAAANAAAPTRAAHARSFRPCTVVVVTRGPLVAQRARVGGRAVAGAPAHTRRRRRRTSHDGLLAAGSGRGRVGRRRDVAVVIVVVVRGLSRSAVGRAARRCVPSLTLPSSRCLDALLQRGRRSPYAPPNTPAACRRPTSESAAAAPLPGRSSSECPCATARRGAHAPDSHPCLRAFLPRRLRAVLRAADQSLSWVFGLDKGRYQWAVEEHEFQQRQQERRREEEQQEQRGVATSV